MKKSLFIALAAAGLLSSCSQNDVENASSSNLEENGLQEIQVGISHQTNVSTRGTGTVGSTSTATSLWNAQSVNIFMLVKDSTTLAVFDPNTDKTAIYDDAKMVTPDGVASGIAQLADKGIKYYPTQGRFDFWGYRLDDAATGKYQKSDTTIIIPFKINGSQDIMAAKAIPSKADTTALGTGNEKRAFSAFSARHNVQPNLTFKHLLTRLTFAVKAGSEDVCDSATGIHIDAIKVLSQATGKLIAVHTKAVDSLLVFDGTIDTLSLMQRKAGAKNSDSLVTLSSIQPKWNKTLNQTDTVNIGEALLVAPASSYKMTIYISQELPISLDTKQGRKKISYSYSADITNIAKRFQAANSYNVILTLYGLQKIDVTTTLTPWTDGGNVEITPEDANY